MTTIERVGQRVYLAGLPFAAKDRAKRLGCHWDADRRQWWIGAAKAAEAESLAAELNGAGGPVWAATEGSRAAAATVGLPADCPAAVVADKLQDGGRDEEAARVRAGGAATEDLSDKRVYAKVEYKGRTYYVIAETADRTRCRLATLQEDGPVFWADMAACRLVKAYPGREVWDGRRYSGRTVTRYTTLGSLRSFVADQRAAAARGDEACGVCGKRGRLVHDLETGMSCCPGCADMPAG